MGITHAFVSSKDQGGDSSLVSRDEWNEDHVVELVGQTLALHYYAPNPSVTSSTSGWTIVDVDATNIAITFTAPSTGNVIVSLMTTYGLSSGYNSYVCLRENSTTLGQARCTFSAGNQSHYMELCWLVTGLTPGSSHTYKWSQYTNGGGTAYMRYGDDGNIGTFPAVMKVIAAS